MIAYRDFVPATVKGKWYEGAKLESFESAVQAAAECGLALVVAAPDEGSGRSPPLSASEGVPA